MNEGFRERVTYREATHLKKDTEKGIRCVCVRVQGY